MWENEDYDSSIVNRVVKEKLDDIEDLKTAAPEMMQLGSAITKVVELLIPYSRGDVIAAVHREGEVVSTVEEVDGLRVRARLSDASAGRLGAYVVGAGDGADHGAAPG